MRILTKCLIAALFAGLSSTGMAQYIVSQAGFGASVAIAGTDIIVGEPLNNRISGQVYVFRKNDSGDWIETQVLSPDDGHSSDRFGVTIDVDGDRFVASATRSGQARGAVYLFQRDGRGAWIQRGKIQPDTLEAGDRFGAGLDLKGDMLFASSTPVEGGGSVYVFRLDEKGGWQQTGHIKGDSTDGNQFGASIEAVDDVLLVGSPRNGHGVVYVYRYDDEMGEWSLKQRLSGRKADDLDDSVGRRSSPTRRPRRDLYGADIHAYGDYVMVSAPNADDLTGVVHTYRADRAGRYQPGLILQPFDAQSSHLFGRDIVFAETQVMVGAVGADNFMGAVYVLEFDVESETFTSAEKLFPENLNRLSFFGDAVAANDSIAVVGAHRDLRGYGSVLVYERRGSRNWKHTATVGSELQIDINSITGKTVSCQDGVASDFPCKNVDLVSFLKLRDLDAPRGVTTNDVWGWTDPETRKEYALIGRTDATSFIDISEPENPILLGTLMRTKGSPMSIWRDVKVYKDHAFIVADGAGAHGVQIFDLTQLREVEDPPVVFQETARYDGIHSAHNIVINEETGFAYTVGNRSGGETCGGGSHMIDIKDPLKPTFAGCFAHTGTGNWGSGYTHDAQCVVYRGPDGRYRNREICFAANETAVSIADVTDKENPVPVATGTYPNSGYTHQGWLSEDHRYFFVNDEHDEINGTTEGTRTLIWDVGELDDPILINEYVSENRATDHNLFIRGHYMYQSNYVSGLRILDVRDVENPVEVGYFDTVNWGVDRPGYGGSWGNYPFFESGVIVVTSAEEGVFFLKRSDVDI